jgi:hypothetical protein
VYLTTGSASTLVDVDCNYAAAPDVERDQRWDRAHLESVFGPGRYAETEAKEVIARMQAVSDAIKAGDLLVFRPYLIHAGPPCSYEQGARDVLFVSLRRPGSRTGPEDTNAQAVVPQLVGEITGFASMAFLGTLLNYREYFVVSWDDPLSSILEAMSKRVEEIVRETVKDQTQAQPGTPEFAAAAAKLHLMLRTSMETLNVSEEDAVILERAYTLK